MTPSDPQDPAKRLRALEALEGLLPALAGVLDIRDVFDRVSSIAQEVLPHDGVVVDTYTTPSGRCGIGFSLQIVDGRTFLYCHLSYLDPTVAPGTALLAGTPVGLVGSTGNSTGPHLHLQLVPADAYPQREAWFQSFAGTAFRWQDGPAPASEPADGVIPFSR